MIKRVCVVITARPSYSRIRSALTELKKNNEIELQIVAAASTVLNNYGTVIRQIKKDGFEIAAEVYDVVSGENVISSAKTAGLGIIELSSLFVQLKPDYVVTIADRFETISTAIAAAYMNIPLIHIQGGEITGNIDEKVRHAITKLADVHLVANEMAKKRLIRMGEDPERVYVTGCPSIDIAREVKEKYEELKFDPIEKYNGVGSLLDNREKYAVVMLHPDTTEIKFMKEQTNMVLKAAEALGLQIYWFWPNVDAGSDIVSKVIRTHREVYKRSKIFYFKNMSPTDFLVLLIGSVCLIGNSSVAIRECSYLSVPAINIGERQHGRDRGNNVIDVKFSYDEILSAYEEISHRKRPESDAIYGDGHAGINISNVIASLNDISVNKYLRY